MNSELILNTINKRICQVSKEVLCRHDDESEIFPIIDAMLNAYLSDIPGCFVEAGCYKGGSTAKLSIIAGLCRRELVSFDSFQGMPENDEAHNLNILGKSIEGAFTKGRYKGNAKKVFDLILKVGDYSCVGLVKGWFKDTLPDFKEKIAVAFIDVDLAESTKTCLKYLYPLLSSGGVLFSHDGLFPLVIDVFNDDAFWEDEVGVKKPVIQGLGKDKLLRIVKD